jgi:hypothetical protein
MSINLKSTFETAHFDGSPATVVHGTPNLVQLLGAAVFSDDDIRELSGAPSNARVEYRLMTQWQDVGDDLPPPGLYFFVTHPTWILHQNAIGLCADGPGKFMVYIKDVFLTDTAPQSLGAVLFKRVVRFCIRYGVGRIRLFGAGGRLWRGNGIGRWAGYYSWPRYGFDMELRADDKALIPHFPHVPSHLGACARVQEVLKGADGKEWWKLCGNGDFMEFDCSPGSVSLVTLEAYLIGKGV